MLAITDKEFEQISAYIKRKFGIRLGPEKRMLLIGRISAALTKDNFRSFTDYYEHIVSDSTGNADIALVNMITTNHTFFMRETNHFDYLSDKILPGLIKTIPDKDLRIWSAGCSTGEEPYTLAMIIDDVFGIEKTQWDTKVLATDLSLKALEAAKKGVYTNESLACLPASWRSRHFTKLDSENSAVKTQLKNEIIFRQFNLMTQAFPFKRKFHVIFCRNVMIYFDEPTKRALINRFYDFTEPGGYLLIGHSESLNREHTGYRYVMPAVYRKD